MTSTGGTGLGSPVEENPRTHVSSSILKRIRLYSLHPSTIFSALFDFSVSWTVGGYGEDVIIYWLFQNSGSFKEEQNKNVRQQVLIFTVHSTVYQAQPKV
jgi:hypothetical protein